MKAAKILGRIVLGILGLAVLLYLVLVAVNWNDQPPSAAVLRINEILATRPQPSAAENGVVYALGFTAPADQDPREVGARRLAWLETFTAQTRKETDPLQNSIDLKLNGSPGVGSLKELCSEGDRQTCAQSFEQVAKDWQPTDMEALALRRYRILLGHRAWRDATFNVAAPLPAYGDVIHAQRLYHLSLLQLAAKGEVDTVGEGLALEIGYWRGAQRNAETLIAKMIALAALRNHFLYSSLALRRLPANQVLRAVPPDWQREFSADERSMDLAIAGEWKWVEEMIGEQMAGGFLLDMEPSLFDRALIFIGKPMFKPQDTLNLIADRHLRFCKQFAVPMNQYGSAKAALEAHVREHPHSISIYNPVGDLVLSVAGDTTYSSYAYRTANPEGMRRAALLVAQLRARNLTANAAQSEVARADLRDPYSDAPFEWDPERSSVIFTAPEEGSRSRHEFFY